MKDRPRPFLIIGNQLKALATLSRLQRAFQYFGEPRISAYGLFIFYAAKQKSLSALRHPVLFVGVIPDQKIDFVYPVGIDHVLHQEAGQY